MADFRKWFIVLAMLTLFAGLAAAQTAPFSCNAVAQVVPTIRAEGLTELVGDIVLTCTGGNAIADGTQIPQANIIVTLTTPVTSRLVNGAPPAPAASPNGLPSEALLLIDEPGAPITPVVNGFGPGQPISVCTSLTGGCVEYSRSVTANNGPLSGQNVGVASGAQTLTPTPTFNTFQGVIPSQGSGQVIFAGVPILPPATTGLSRVYRITNIRVVPQGNSLVGLVPIQAYISTSGVTSLPIVQNVVTVAFAQNSLATSSSAASTVFTQCNKVGPDIATAASGTANVAVLNFTERFPSAFKTRVAALTTNAGSSYLATNYPGGSAPAQNIPGQLYNSESGLIVPIPGSMTGQNTPGLANFGTRLKAVFTNLPAGVTVWVSQFNVNTSATGGGYLSGSVITTPGPTDVTSYARLTQSETAEFKDPAGSSISAAYGTGGVPVVAIATTSASSTTATAVWEVVNANLAANETFSFAVYLTYTPAGTAPNQTPPATTTANNPTVTLSYAPTPSATNAAAWALPQPGGGTTPAGVPIPRFALVTATGSSTAFTILACQTVLLFPYVTSAANMNTGMAISNTGLDPLTPTTTAGTGFCTLYFYGHNASGTLIKPGTTPPKVPSSATSPNGLAQGDTTAFTLYDVFGANLSGYMFAACDFQYAHGFAYISDFSNTNLAMGYLALLVNTNSDPAKGMQLLGRPGAQAAESLNQ